MKIQRFEDLECWQEARKLVNMVYKTINNSERFKKDYRLRDQATAAAVSTMSNIAEGFSRKSNKEFIQFLYISKSSASEIQSISYAALDQSYIDKESFDKIYNQADKVSQIDSGFIRYLSSQRNNAITPKRNNAFTFIELLITLAVITICFLPLMRMFSVSLEQVYVTEDLTTARYLAQEGMEKVKNLGFTEAQLEDLGDIWEPPLAQPPLELNGKYWRSLRKIVKGTDPLEIRIQVYQITGKPANRQTGKPITEVVTLMEDLDWTPIE